MAPNPEPCHTCHTVLEQKNRRASLRYESWRASGGFLENAGTRVDYASRSDDALSPKAALALRPDDATEIVASAAWARRFPTIGELYQAGLISYGPDVGQIDLGGFDPDLAPERKARYNGKAVRS